MQTEQERQEEELDLQMAAEAQSEQRYDSDGSEEHQQQLDGPHASAHAAANVDRISTSVMSLASPKALTSPSQELPPWSQRTQSLPGGSQHCTGPLHARAHTSPSHLQWGGRDRALQGRAGPVRDDSAGGRMHNGSQMAGASPSTPPMNLRYTRFVMRFHSTELPNS